MEYADFIKSVLMQAGEMARKSFGKVSGTIKPDDPNQVLTETDLAISKLITEKINQNYPDHNIIDEETGAVDKKSEFTWVIDPIDGTSNFAVGVPMYGHMIGLLKDTHPIAGGIFLPEFKEFYYAEKGQGALCNDQHIQVSQEKNLLNSLISYSLDGHRENPQQTITEVRLLAEIILNIRNLRISNSCYDFTLVANGRYGGYLSQTSKIWDNVAAQVIIEEAGGIYTDFFGKPIDYTNALTKTKQTFHFCCGSPALHRQLQEIIHEFGKKNSV